MTNTNKILVSLALVMALVFAMSRVFAAGPKEESAEAKVIPFTILIVGTRHFSDVDLIRTNVRKMAYVSGFAEQVSSQNHVAFAGTYSGNPDTLVSDIESLVADRFDFQKKDYKDRGLVITLRKISGTGQ